MQDFIERPALDVTITATMKHTALLNAVRKLGSQKALSDYLGITQQMLGKWLKLSKCPPMKANKYWSAEKLVDLEVKLLEVTGQTMDELFPASLRLNQDFLNSPKRTEKRVQMESHMLAHYADSTTRRLAIAADPAQGPDLEEQREKIESAVGKLRGRKAEIIRRRFLEGNESYKDIGKSMRITAERVRQLEAKAICDLQGAAGKQLNTLRRYE